MLPDAPTVPYDHVSPVGNEPVPPPGRAVWLHVLRWADSLSGFSGFIVDVTFMMLRPVSSVADKTTRG